MDTLLMCMTEICDSSVIGKNNTYSPNRGEFKGDLTMVESK